MSSNIDRGFYQLLGFVILFKCVSAGGYLGEPCTLKSTHATGRCKFIFDCPKALEDLHTRGIYPQTCGFDGDQPVVCCTEDISSTKPFPGSRSQQKCKQYREHYKNNIAIVPLPGLHVPIKEECDFLDFAFYQGHIARRNEFPHMAAIGYDGQKQEKSWLCSGALISEQFVITAAHCLTDRPHGQPKYIRIGDLDLSSHLDDTSPLQEFKVAGIFMHPEFEPPSFYNDIGLLKMDRPAKFYSNARPACLNTNPSLDDKKYIVAGWGQEKYISDISTHLLKENLHYFSHAECAHSYKNVTFDKRLKNGIVDATQLCAVPLGNDMCDMSTGVLQIYNKEEYCMYTIVGITSFGRTSGNVHVPDVFTKVSAYTHWIEGIIWP